MMLGIGLLVAFGVAAVIILAVRRDERTRSILAGVFIIYLILAILATTVERLLS